MSKFENGNPGGPGRPKGSRNKLGEVFCTELLKQFEEHGVQAITDVREANPANFINTISKVCPSHLAVSGYLDVEELDREWTIEFVESKNSIDNVKKRQIRILAQHQITTIADIAHFYDVPEQIVKDWGITNLLQIVHEA